VVPETGERSATGAVLAHYNYRYDHRAGDLKMKPQSSVLSVLIAVVFALSGCATVPKDGQADQVRIYRTNELVWNQYEVVRYLPVDSWRSTFWLPTAASEAEGIALLQAEAARSGANGLTNVVCIDQGHFMWSWSREPSLLCYGEAIRVR
jgi:hypothetical protein